MRTDSKQHKRLWTGHNLPSRYETGYISKISSPENGTLSGGQDIGLFELRATDTSYTLKTKPLENMTFNVKDVILEPPIEMWNT